MANTSAKIGLGWEPAVTLRKVRDPLTNHVETVCRLPGLR
jgi:hypothetical protein